MPSQGHRPPADIPASGKRMWLFIIAAPILFFLWATIASPEQQLYDGAIETQNARKEQEQPRSVDEQPVRALCETSKAMKEHADFFSALRLDPFANDFNPIRMGVDQHHEGVKAIRRAYRGFEQGKDELNRDVPAAALALLDEDSLRIYLGWVEEKANAEGWTVDWEKHCDAELSI